MAAESGGSAGVGWLRDLQPAALEALAVITAKATSELEGMRPRTSFGQNADGSIFFVAVGIDSPFRVRFAFLDRDGDVHPTTGYEAESAVREACRIGPWDVHQLLEKLGEDAVDVGRIEAS